MKLFAISLLLLTAIHVFAQKDDQARRILAEVSAKYKTFNVIKTGFTYSLESPQANLKQTQSGLLIARPSANQFNVTLYAKGSKTPLVEQELISDGKLQWTYLKKDNEVQVNNVAASDDALNPARVFSMYERGYKYVYGGEQKAGGVTCQVIDMTPTDSKKNIFKVRLLIDKVKKQIYNATLFDKNGNKYGYTMQSFTANYPVPDAVFTFNVKAHPGVEVVDLR